MKSYGETTISTLKIGDRYRIRGIETDKGTCYRIDEIVTPKGEYITWYGLYSNVDQAKEEIKKNQVVN